MQKLGEMPVKENREGAGVQNLSDHNADSSLGRKEGEWKSLVAVQS